MLGRKLRLRYRNVLPSSKTEDRMQFWQGKGGTVGSMSTIGASENFPEGSADRGLWRLMLKLPAIRAQLQFLAARHSSIRGLFEAYEDACVTLGRLRSEPGETNCPLVREYETICSEIEADVLKYCLDRKPTVPQ
jgi:hypothetical protein